MNAATAPVTAMTRSGPDLIGSASASSVADVSVRRTVPASPSTVMRWPSAIRLVADRGAQHGGDAVLTGDDRAVAERPADVGDHGGRAGEQRRPGRCGDGGDQHLPGLQPGEVLRPLEHPGHRRDPARRWPRCRSTRPRSGRPMSPGNMFLNSRYQPFSAASGAGSPGAAPARARGGARSPPRTTRPRRRRKRPAPARSPRAAARRRRRADRPHPAATSRRPSSASIRRSCGQARPTSASASSRSGATSWAQLSSRPNARAPDRVEPAYGCWRSPPRGRPTLRRCRSYGSPPSPRR